VKSRLATYKYSRWVEFLSDLRKIATGKTQTHPFKLREQAREPRRTAPARS